MPNGTSMSDGLGMKFVHMEKVWHGCADDGLI